MTKQELERPDKMSAFCGCFKSSAQVDNSKRRPGHRPSIQKQNSGMDLLMTNKQGMDPDAIEEEDWPSDQVAGHIRGSHQTEMLHTQSTSNMRSGFEEPKVRKPPALTQQVEDVFQKAIDEFMRSPKANSATRQSMVAQSQPALSKQSQSRNP